MSKKNVLKETVDELLDMYQDRNEVTWNELYDMLSNTGALDDLMKEAEEGVEGAINEDDVVALVVENLEREGLDVW